MHQIILVHQFLTEEKLKAPERKVMGEISEQSYFKENIVKIIVIAQQKLGIG